MKKTAGKILLYLFYALLGILGVKYLLPCLAPMLLAFVLAALMEGAVRSMVKHGWRRSLAALVLTVCLVSALAALCVFALSRGMGWLMQAAKNLPDIDRALDMLTGEIKTRLDNSAASGSFIYAAVDSLAAGLYSLPAKLSQSAVQTAAGLAKHAPDALLFAVTAGIGTYFISAAYPKVRAFLLLQLGSGTREKLGAVLSDFRGSFLGFLRAQAALMGITFFQLLLFFALMKLRGALPLAFVTALVDALPVFGVGTVLLPWAVFCALTGQMRRALSLCAAWGVCMLVRSCLQAKLLGDSIGLEPLVSLLFIYVGWRVCGVWGMLLFPLGFVTVKRLNDSGIISLWKSAE